MFRIKICGITTIDDARAAVDAGADAIGLNFFEQSPRRISLEQAARICDSLHGEAIPIGVIVNHDRETIAEIVASAGLYGVQLHGDEPPEFVAELVKAAFPQPGDAALQKWQKFLGRGVVRARRVTDDGVAAIAADLEACRTAGGAPSAVLVDAHTPGRYGGTGETVSWAGLADYKRWLGDVPLILAGGLTPDNVAEAIRVVRPHGVDVASGVESSPGKKDHGKVRAFVTAAREALP